MRKSYQSFDDAAYLQRQMTEETQFHGDSISAAPIEHLRPYSADSASRASRARMVRAQPLVRNSTQRQNALYENLNEELYNNPSSGDVRRVRKPEYNYRSQFQTAQAINVFEIDEGSKVHHLQRLTPRALSTSKLRRQLFDETRMED